MRAVEYEGRDLEAMSFARKYHEWILSLFRNFLGVRVAEVGAGSGNFTALLAHEPITELVAIEPSRNMFAILAKRVADDARIVAHQAYFPDISPQYREHFDSVVYINVLEHVEKDSEELARIYESLRPGGYVCLFVPALPWLYSAHDASIGHFRRYAKSELCERVRAAGFAVVSIRYFDMLGIVSWLVLLKWGLLKGKPTAGNISFYDTYVVPVSRALESLVAPPIGKNLLLIGRKPLA